MNLSLTLPQPSLSPSLPTTQNPNPRQPSQSPHSPIPNPNHKPSVPLISYAKCRVLVRSSSRHCSRIVRSVEDSSALLGGADGDEEEEEKVVGEPSFWEFVGAERFKVVAMIAVALVLCNADRVVMSVAIIPLSLANGWRQSFAGVVQSSFLWGYLISPIAGGILVDYYGGKKVLAWGVSLWSVATFLTPRAAETSLWALLAMRVLVGVAEGVALPCMNNMILRWFPTTERSRAVGLALAGFQLGNAIGLMLSPVFMSWFGVFGPFMVFGSLGFLWVLLWLSNISSTPDQSQRITRYELEYIRSNSTKSFMIASNLKNTRLIPPFRRLLSKMPTWSLIVANMMQSWGYFLFLSWMPIYFKTVYNVDIRQAAWFSAVPWTIMALVGYFAGATSDMLIKRGMSITLTRKIMQSIGFVGPAISLIGLTLARHPSTASAWLSLAVGLKSFSNLGFLVNLQNKSAKTEAMSNLHKSALQPRRLLFNISNRISCFC